MSSDYTPPVGGGGGSAANIQLSNLDAANAINVDLNLNDNGILGVDRIGFDSNDNELAFLGNNGDTLTFSNAVAGSFGVNANRGLSIGFGANFECALNFQNNSFFSWVGSNNGQISIDNNTSGQFNIEAILVGGNPTNILVQTSDNGGGDSGDICLRTGTASGTRGVIKLVDGSLAGASNGYVWTLIDQTTGEGAWAAAGGGGGANTALSNLAGVAINMALEFGVGIVGQVTTDSSLANSPSMEISTGSTLNNTGPINILTGSSTGPGSFTGGILIKTGNNPASTGAIEIVGGDVTDAPGTICGRVLIQAGRATNFASTIKGGDVEIVGGIGGGSGNGGDVKIDGGQSVTGQGGNVELEGGAAGGANGIIDLKSVAKLLPLNADPTAPDVRGGLQGGLIYYNATTGKFRGYNAVAAAWQDLN